MAGALLSTLLAEKLSTMILVEGIYPPGSRLPTERELADKLGVSRTSVREAVKQLTARGVLEVRRGVGTFVSENPGVTSNPLGIDSSSDVIAMLADWYRVRMILEGDAMQMVVEAASDEELRGIRAIMEEEVSLANTVDADFMTCDQHFHCALARATHNIIMERLIPSLHASVYYDMVKSQYARLRSRYNRNAIGNHALLMRHLEQRDAAGAITAMRFHMLQAIEDITSLRDAPQ